MVSVYAMSPQFVAMSAYDGFSNFVNNQTTSAPSISGSSSESTSPPWNRSGEIQPSLANNPHQSNLLHDDDASADDDVLDGCLQSNAPDSKPHSSFQPYAKDQPKLLGGHGSKLKTTTAERRATHNAIERARRESLNGRFLELARALPTMHNVKRPSKSVIVNKSLEWICESQVREYELARENAFLRNHINELRAQLHMEPLSLNRTLAHQSQAPYKVAGFHPLRASGIDSNYSSTAPHPPPFNQLPTQGSHSYGSKQRPLSASDDHEGQISPRTQPGDVCNSMPGPFSTPHPPGQRNYLASNLYESSDGSDKTIEQLKLSRSQSFAPTQNDENISPIYFPGLSIQTDSSSPFQALSESDGLLSTAGSSPPRLRYFSSSGSSDASDNSPSHVDYPTAAPHFESERKPFNESRDRLNSGAVQVGILGGCVASVNNRQGMPDQPDIGAGVSRAVHAHIHDITLPVENKLLPADFGAHSVPVQRHPSHTVHFPPANYVSSLHTSSEVYENPQSLPQVPRGSLVGANAIDSSMLAISPVVNPGVANESTTGFPIGATWVWG